MRSGHPVHLSSSPTVCYAMISCTQEDGNFEQRTQRFRQVPEKLKQAVGEMLSEHAALQQRRQQQQQDGGAAAGGAGAGGLTALLHLGDIIDGYGSDPDNRCALDKEEGAAGSPA